MPLSVGQRAPVFRLRGVDNAYWILGEPDERRSVLIVFFRREDATCRLLLPFVERLHRRAHVHPAEILGISLDNHRDTLELAEDFCFTFPILIESPGLETCRSYGVSELPALFRLDRSLKVQGMMTGWSKDRFEQIARAYLHETGAQLRTVWETNDQPPETARAVAVGRWSGEANRA